MAERVFFHIGAPKTGTTFVQLAMWNNRDRLRDQGVLYPGRRMDHFFATLTVREQPFDDHHPPRARSAWSRLVEEVGHWDQDAVVSHEFFGAASADQARGAIEALAPAEVHLVFTARDYVRQLPAYWQQTLKSTHYADSLDNYVRAALADELDGLWTWLTMDVSAVLGRWAKHVPPERVHVVTVPREGASHDLFWQRYASVVGIDPGSCDLREVRPNVSLGVVEAELLRRIKPKVPGSLTDTAKMHRWQRRYLTHDLLVPRAGRRFGLRADDAATLCELSRRTASDLAASGYDVVGDLEDLVPQSDPPALPHPEDTSDAELLDAATDTVGLMLRDLDQQTLRAEDAERAVAGTRKKMVAERSRARAREAELQRAVDEASARIAALEREVTQRHTSRLKTLLVALSDRNSGVMRLRVRYRMMKAVTRGRRRSGR